jgi:outer membrane lipopolysaccharide assembly protein LptE/RlpB
MRHYLALGFAITSATAIIAGCGYHVAGRSTTLPTNIRVIAVPALENKTSTYRIEQQLTAATIHEFLAKTQFHIVSDPSSADAVLQGKVTSLEITPLLFTTTTNPATGSTQTAQATTMLITMRCDVTLLDRLDQKVLYHNDNFLFRNQYELASGTNPDGSFSQSGTESFFQEGSPALERMSRDFAARLVSAVTENY